MLEDILPTLYAYKIVQSSVVSAENFQCEIRAKIDCEEDFLRWIKEFESATHSSWILRKSVRSSEKSRHRFSRDYLCQHSNYRKKKDASKNKNCSASLTVRTKRDTRSVRGRDSMAKDGYMSIIKINFMHSHKINVAESWNWLPRCEETKRIFIDLFNSGMNPATAKNYHEAMLLSESPESLANSRINPPVRWIYRLYQKWEEENFGKLNSEPSFNTVMVNKIDKYREKLMNIGKNSNNVNSIKEEPSIISENYPEPLSSQSVAAHFKVMMGNIAILLQSCNDQGVLSSAEKFYHKHKHIETTTDLQSFFDECLSKN